MRAGLFVAFEESEELGTVFMVHCRRPWEEKLVDCKGK
jgi:hypothetical protein